MSEAAPMVTISLRYVVSDVDRYGHVRHYLRRPGMKKVRLPGAPGSAEFMAAYHSAEGDELAPVARKARDGTFGALVIAYYSSPEFARLDTSTRAWRRRHLDLLRAADGHLPVAPIEPADIVAMVEELASKPSVANHRLKALRALFKWGLNRGRIRNNPTLGVSAIAYHSDGVHTWSLDEVGAYEDRHKLGTKARLAMAILLCSAGRREDAVRLGPQHVKGGRLRFVQAKNEHRKPVEVDIPIHADLADAIAACPSGHLNFLVTEFGKPFTPAGFGNWFRDRCNEAGLHHCSAHGLRKAAAVRLAEAGASPHEIMAVTGHRTLAEVERYTRSARMARLADSGFAKLAMKDKG